ncbi:MFS transporter [Aquihabitans sp. G128]|uniref:MFS transporter n=1 Tax=Aquihabitans sp. G128 TaxID=2849779 RepID=UPI001C250D7C|nr:MFS transporter [Aquihabitans sp. G128]QXC59479.1 MFS transporter [Aquihabitans sp. G128]
MDVRKVMIDLTPLREHRDLRLLLGGELVSVVGTQLTIVAVMFQVYALTGSSLYVGLVSLAELVPLLAGALVGGAVVDAVDRRKLLLVVTALMGLSSAALALNADRGAVLWPLFVFPAVTAALSGFDSPARRATMTRMLPTEQLSTANAMFQVLAQLGLIVGPAIAGLLLGGVGIRFVYWIDVASFGACFVAIAAMAPQPAAAGAAKPGLRSIVDGFRFVRTRPALRGAFLIDINAMVFGLPRALFPALALHRFGGGASTLGFLYAAPGAGALVGAATTGWVADVRRQGQAVIVAVVAWGAAIAAFGLVAWLPVALLLLAVAGWADVISAVFRTTIIQVATPDHLQGRLSSLQTAVVTGGPRLGDMEAGSVASAFGNQFSVVSGGLACIVCAMAVAWLIPGFRRQGLDPESPSDPAAPALA